MHFPHVSDGTKHKLALGAAALMVVGVAYAIHMKNHGDDLGSEQSDPNSGFGGGLSNLLHKVASALPSGGGGNLPSPPSYEEIPQDTGGSAYTLDGPPTDTGSSPAVQNFLNTLNAPSAPAPTESAPVTPYYDNSGGEPVLMGNGVFAPGFTVNGNPINPLTGGDVTPQDLANLGQNAGAAYYDPTATADNNAAQFYSQPGNVDANGQSWVGGSPPTT